MKKIILIICVVINGKSFSQNTGRPFLHIQDPSKETNQVHSSRQFIIGSTCKGCSLSINGKEIRVYPTGAFAYEVNLKQGEASYNLVATALGINSISKKISFIYSLPPLPDTVRTLDIASIETYPEGNLYVQAGDKIRLRVKTMSGATVTARNDIPLYEMPVSFTNGMPGIYQGEYIIKEKDSFLVTRLPVTVRDNNGRFVTKESKYWFSTFSPLAPNIAITKGRLAHLLFGLGEDRLGGAKIGYLDSMVLLEITGKVGTNYKVRLSKYHTSYIPEDLVTFLPKGSFTPQSLTGTWRVYGDANYDYVNIGLFARLPYQSVQLVDPSRIVVDIYGATNNTNWITQLENTREIKNVFYQQIEDEVFRVTIELIHPQHWGYSIYYNKNTLVIKVRHQPADLSLNKLIIAVDAGHGGSNEGAVGPTGIYEKNMTLAVALKLQKSLEREGAKVIMTRNKEQFFDNKERILFYRDSLPDLLVSIHLNSASDPIRVSGTSTYYRYIGFRKLSQFIYKRMLELGLKEYGNTGSFNFMLNSPIEYPNALVETLFISNPEDEMKILDEDFQQQIADKIILGIKDFLEESKKAL